MPGQPLSTFRGTINPQFGPGSIAKRPTLAAYVMLIIETWSFIEPRLYLMVSQCLLEQEPIIATAMLQAIDSQTAQRVAILAAVKSVLADEDWALFEAGFHSTTASRNVRNQFAHHLWGFSEELPDALLLLDPKYFNADLAKRSKSVYEAKKQGKPFGGAEIDRTGMTVWRERDFKEEALSAKRASDVIVHLNLLLRAVRQKKTTDSIRKWLLSDSLIQQKIQKATTQKPPATPP